MKKLFQRIFMSMLCVLFAFTFAAPTFASEEPQPVATEQMMEEISSPEESAEIPTDPWEEPTATQESIPTPEPKPATESFPTEQPAAQPIADSPALSAQSEEFTVQGVGTEFTDASLKYTVLTESGSDGTAALTGANSGVTVVTVPATAENDGITYAITQIAANAFNGNTELFTLNLSGAINLAAIGDGAFSGCDGLWGTVKFPSSLAAIGQSAFYGCESVRHFDFSDAANLQSIGTNAFRGCYDITYLAFFGATPPTIAAGAMPTFSSFRVYYPDAVKAAYEEQPGVQEIPAGNRYTFAPPSSASSATLPRGGSFLCAGTGNANYYWSLTGAPSGIEIDEDTGLLQVDMLAALGTFHFTVCANFADYTVTQAYSLTVTGSSSLGNFTADGLHYSILYQSADYRYVAITGADTGVSAVVVPATVENGGNLHYVVEIADNAFQGNTAITELDLSGADNLLTIGNSAFSGCTALTGQIVFPHYLDVIGINAFSGCTALQSALILGQYSGLYVQSGVFSALQPALFRLYYPVYNQEKYEAQPGISEVPAAQRRTCGFIDFGTAATLPPGGSYRFSATGTATYQWSLIGAPAGVSIDSTGMLTAAETTQRGSYNITVMISVAGYSDTRLFALTIDGAVPIAYNGLHYTVLSESGNTGTAALSGPASATSITVPATIQKDGVTYEVTQIAANAFKNVRPTSLDLSGATNLTSIGDNAFYQCTTLAGTVKIPASVTSLGEASFVACQGLTTLDLSAASSLVSIGKHAFAACTDLTALDFAGATALTTIGPYAFSQCVGVTGTVKIPPTVITIAEQAFSICDEIDALDLSAAAALTSIGNSAFSGCYFTNALVIPSNVISIGPAAFDNSFIEGLDLSGATSLQTIGGWAFSNCSYLAGTIVIPANLVSIGEDAFSWCPKITKVDCAGASKLTTIGRGAFGSCYALAEVNLSGAPKLQTVGTSTFYACRSLASLVFYNAVPPVVESSTFYTGAPFKLYYPHANKVAYEQQPGITGVYAENRYTYGPISSAASATLENGQSFPCATPGGNVRSGAPIAYTWTLSGAPAGVSIDANTGLLTANNTVAGGTHVFTITAATDFGWSSTQEFSLTISEEPPGPSSSPSPSPSPSPESTLPPGPTSSTDPGNNDGGTTEPTPVEVQSVKTQKTLYLVIGKSVKLPYAVYPANTEDKTVSWTIKNAKIATVNSKTGAVRGMKAGKTIVTVKTANGKTAYCTVVIVKAPLKQTKLTLSKKGTVALVTGKTLQLKATASPGKATQAVAKWKSSNSAIASVDAMGLVIAKQPGKTTITATANGKSAKVIITVGDTAARKISMPKKVALRRGKTLTLKPTLVPADTSPAKLTWNSSDKSVATISAKGVIKAKTAGKTVITVTTWNGKTAKCTVTVK